MTWQIAMGIGAVLIGAIGFGLFLWRRDIQKSQREEIENETNKKALDDLRKASDAQAKIRDEFDAVRSHTPNDWDNHKRMQP